MMSWTKSYLGLVFDAKSLEANGKTCAAANGFRAVMDILMMILFSLLPWNLTPEEKQPLCHLQKRPGKWRGLVVHFLFQPRVNSLSLFFGSCSHLSKLETEASNKITLGVNGKARSAPDPPVSGCPRPIKKKGKLEKEDTPEPDSK